MLTFEPLSHDLYEPAVAVDTDRFVNHLPMLVHLVMLSFVWLFPWLLELYEPHAALSGDDQVVFHISSARRRQLVDLESRKLAFESLDTRPADGALAARGEFDLHINLCVASA